MSETTPGQLVYETGHRGYAVDEDWSPTPWAELTAAEHADWETAAKAATVTAWRLLDEARTERDRLRELLNEAAIAEPYELDSADIGPGTRHSADVIVWNKCAACEAMARAVEQRRALVAEILAEVELGTLGQHTPAATTRTLARTAEWRQRAGLEG